MYDLVLLQGIAEIKKIQNYWPSFIATDPKISVYASVSWFDAWLKTLTPDHNALMILVRKAGELKALVPLTAYHDELYLGAFSPFAFWLGSIDKADVWIAIRKILENIPNWQIIYAVNCMPFILKNLIQAGWQSLPNARGHISHIDLSLSSKDFLSTLNPQTRQSIRRKTRRLAEQGVTFEVFNNNAVFKAAESLIELYIKKWGHLGRRRAVELEIMQAFQQQDELCITGLMKGKFPIALLAGLCNKPTKSWHAYLSAFDTTFSHFSPGLVLHNYSIQWAITAGYTSYHFGFGDEPFKTSLGARLTEVMTIFQSRHNTTTIASGPRCPMPAFL